MTTPPTPRAVIERADVHTAPCIRKRCRTTATYVVVDPHTGDRVYTCGFHLGGCTANLIARQHVAVATMEAS